MSKNKVIDTSLVDRVQANNDLYSTFIPKVNVYQYVQNMQYPTQTAKEKGSSNWADAFAIWNKNRNSVNKDTYSAKYIEAQNELEELYQAQQYLLDKQQLDELYANLESYDDSEKVAEINKLQRQLNNNKESYDKIFNKYFNQPEIRYVNQFNAVQPVKNTEDYISDIENIIQKRIKESDDNLQEEKKYSEKTDYWDKKISKYYKNKSEMPGMDFTDIDTYIYKLPGLMGSSAGTMGASVAGFASGLLLSNPITAPLGVAGLVSSNLYSRDFESYAEVYQAYKSKVKSNAQKDKVYDDVIRNARKQLEDDPTTDKSKLNDDDFVLDQILLNRVNSNNIKFNNNLSNSFEGLQSVYKDNMALSTVDVVQDLLAVVPLGKMLKSIGSVMPNKVLSTTKKAKKLYDSSKERLEDVLDYGLEGMNKIPKKNIRKRIVDLGGRMVLSSVLEGSEEGTQYMLSKDYEKGIYDNDANIISRWIDNVGRGIRSTYAALTPWDGVYSSDREFMENYKGGALLGGIMTGVYGGISTAIDVRNQASQIQVNDAFSRVLSDRTSDQDLINKNKFYSKNINNKSWDKVENAFDNLQESGIEGFSKEDIEEERQRARRFHNLYTSDSNRSQAEQLGIDIDSEEYTDYTTLKQYHMDKTKEAFDQKRQFDAELNNLANNEEVNQYIDQLVNKLDKSDPIRLRSAIVTKAKLDAVNQLLLESKEDVELANKLYNKSGLKLNRSSLREINKYLQNYRDQLKKDLSNYGYSESVLQVPTIHKELLEAAKKAVSADIVHIKENDDLLDIQSSDKDIISKKIEKFKKAQEDSQQFAQEVNDAISGVTQERVEEEAKEVTIPSISKPEPVIEQEPSKATVEEKPKPVEDKQLQPEQKEEPEELKVLRESAIKNKQYLEDKESQYYEINKETDKILEKLVRLKYPKVNKYNERVASYKMQDDAELDNYFQDLYTARMQLEEAILSTDDKAIDKALINLARISEEAEALSVKDESEQAKTKYLDSINESKKDKVVNIPTEVLSKNNITYPKYTPIVSMIKEYLGQERDGQYAYDIEITSFDGNEKETKSYTIKSTTPLHDIQPTIEQEEKASNIKDQQKQQDKKYQEQQSKLTVTDDKVEEQPQQPHTLTDVMNGFLGDTYTQALEEQKQQQQQAQEVEVTPLNYDRNTDPYSHQLGYHLTEAKQDKDGKWHRVSIPYTDAKDLTNNEEFAKITGQPDFYQEVIKNGVEIKVYPNFKHPKSGKVVDNIYFIFNYKGKKYGAYLYTLEGMQSSTNRLPYQQKEVVLNNLKALREKILKLNEIAKNNPNLKVVPTHISTSNGRYVPLFNEDGSPNNRPLSEAKFLPEKDLYKIDYTNTRVSITTGTAFGSYERRGTTITSLKGSPMGSIRLHTTIKRQDGTEGDMSIQLNYKTFKDDRSTAEYIVDLLLNSTQNVVTKEGQTLPLKNLDLLKLIVNFGSHTATNPNDNRFTEDQRKARLSKQFYETEDGHFFIGNTSYSRQELVGDKRQEAIKYIMDNFHWNLDEDNLTKNWFSGDAVVSGFQYMKKWFQNSKADKITLIPGVLQFTKEDFGINNTNPNGISSLGWYIKQGILLTNTSDTLEDVNLYVDDVTLIDTNSIDNSIQKQQEVQQKSTQSQYFDLPGEGSTRNQFTMDDINAILDGNYGNNGPNMTVERVADRLDVQEATTWLSEKLGIEPIIVPNVIEVTEAGLQVVGRARIDSIILSEEAPQGAEYHEAWHRVSQLLISDRKRKQILKRYMKNGMNEKQADEMLAEEYRNFMLYASSKKDGLFKFDFDSKNWFRRVFDFTRLWIRTGQYGLAKVMYYTSIGKYKGLQPSKENIDRFKKIYPSGSNMIVNGVTLKNITTEKQLDDIVKSLLYAFFQTNFNDTVLDYNNVKKTASFEKLLRLLKNTQASDPKAINPVMDEIIERFDDVIIPRLITKLKGLGIRAFDTQNSEITDIEEGGEVINVGQHTVEGMNISIKDNAPAEAKFFFQTVPVLEYNKEGKLVNKLHQHTGFAQFYDSNFVWNSILKDLAGCRTIKAMVNTIAYKSNNDLFYKSLLNRFVTLMKQSVGNNPYIAIKAESMLSKLETVITSDVNNYLTVKTEIDENEYRKTRVLDNGIDIKAMKYPGIWSKSLFYNSGIFQYSGQDVIATKNAKHTLQVISDRIGTLVNVFSQKKGILVLKDKSIDFHDVNNLNQLKASLINLFNTIGIGIDEETLNRLLDSGVYGNVNDDAYTKLSNFITSTANYGGLLSIKSTIDMINKSIDKDRNVKQLTTPSNAKVKPDQIFNNSGFVKVLANNYAYVHATDSGLSTIGAEGNTYYKVSQNNFFKDRVNELNTDSKEVNNLQSVVYNKHSIILDRVSKGDKLTVETFINFKDEESREKGRDYFGITDREDYIAKMTMVLNDRIISPTIGDKKTYHVISGVKLYHEPVQFNRFEDGSYFANYGINSVDAILGYAKDEYERVKLTMAQLDPESPEYLQPNQRIKNYHTPNKGYQDKNKVTHKVEPNGTRFISFDGIYTNKGFISFNDPKKSSAENLKIAEENFFSLPIEHQRLLLSGVISNLVKKEIQTAKELGIITANKNNDVWSIRNVLLDDYLIEERMSRYSDFDTQNAQAFAIWDIISDYTIGTIISVNEIEKVFSGDPAYYKIEYNEEGMVDNSVDKIKRSTALTSTGTNNRLDFFNDLSVPTEYTVAELKDHEVKSKQYDLYEELFFRGNIKETIQELHGQEAWDSVKDKDISEISKVYPEAVKIARQAAQADVSGYKSGINVADAAVYISPTMFKNLMRMQGNWSKEIKEAFDILTNEETADTWESDPRLYAKANKVILNSLKYMAFGTRYRNGLGIPYFNKMALFPLFKSIATGDLKPLYDRMMDKDNPLDMVMFNSAVKAGSEDAQSYYEGTQDREIELKDGSMIVAAELMDIPEQRVRDLNKLHVYKQSFKYLRQQLLTDPHVHEEQMAGTQFLKVNLSNLRMSDMYGPDGDQVSGQEIKDNIMNALNRLSDIGKQKLSDKLLDSEGNVNEVAVAKMLLDDAMESDANDNIISGLKKVIEEGSFDAYPLSALSDNKWLESRFISLINKNVIDVQLPGGAFIQRSVFGVEATDTRVITSSMINDGRHLKSINEEGSMDAVVSINLLKHIIPDYDKMTFREARQWLIDHNIIGQNAKANSIGYRIPTQSIASISALRFVDVFPEIMGDVVMLPEDFTKLTGSDKYHCLNQYNIKNLFNCWKTLRALTDWATSSQAVRYNI